MSLNTFKQNHSGSSDVGSNCVGGKNIGSTSTGGEATTLKRLIDILDKQDFAPHESGNGWSSLCPAHEDNNPSLSISEGADGRVLLKCHAGCEVEAVVEAIGLTMADLFPPKQSRSRKCGPVVATYDYTDESGTLLFQACRHDPKNFTQRRPDGQGGWFWNLQGVRRVLYRLAALIEAVKCGKTVYLAEGEKDVEALVEHGLDATCNPLGAGKWWREYSKFLRGADVVIVVDKDPVGRKHAQEVASSLNGVAKSCRLIELPDREGKAVKDAFDWFAAGGTSEELITIVAAIPANNPGVNPAAGQSGQVGHVSATPSGENLASDGCVSDNPGQFGHTPATWFNEKYPQLTDKYGDAVLEKFKNDGSISIRDLNEDFLAATLGATGNPDAPTVYIPTEDKFYTYSPTDGIYLQRRESVLQAGLSKVLLECARDCAENCDAKALEFRFRDTASLSGVIKRAHGLLEVPHDYFANDLTEFIPCANGILRLTDRVPLEFSPDYRRRNKLAVPFNPTAQCPQFLDVLMRPALDEFDLELVQRWCGLALVGENLAQKILILTGTAGGGKGTFIRVLFGIIGAGNLASLRTQLLGERFELSRFLGKTLLYGADVPENFLNDRGASVLKSLTGYDPVTLEFKNSNESPCITCKFNVVVTSNSRLTVKLEGDNDAWRRRLIVIEYKKPKPKNSIADLDQQILQQEGSGVLNWMLEGLFKLRADGWQLKVQGGQQARVDNLLLESDAHAVFVREGLTREAAGQVNLADCFAAYVDFCTQRGWAALTQNKFGKLIGDAIVRQFGLTQRHDLRDAAGKMQRGWKGISVINSSGRTGENLSDLSGMPWSTDPNALCHHVRWSEGCKPTCNN